MTRRQNNMPHEKTFYQAFRLLMPSKPIDRISVDDLAEKTGLSRRTFYRHFGSMDDMLKYSFKHHTEDFISEYSKKKPYDFKTMIITFFECWHYSDKGFLFAMKHNNKLDLFLQYFMAQTRELLAKPFEPQNGGSPYAVYTPYFIVSCLCGILVKWLEDGARLKPEDMVRVAIEIMKVNLLAKK